MIVDDDHDLIVAGYKPQLHRHIGFFASFAVSFSFMSVLMGIFANYGYVLGKAGPFGMWTWPIVGIGQMFVALVFAEMAGRIPITGALYNWNAKLGHPLWSWLVGWLTVFAYTIGGVGIDVALLSPLQSLVGISFTMNAIRWIGVSIIILQLVINIYGVHIAMYINRFAVIAEIIALVFFGFLLAIVIAVTGQAHPALLVSLPQTPVPYWPAFLASTLMGTWTIFGFETPADLSEETIDAKRIAPKSILVSVATTAILGFLFILVLTIAIPDVSTITASSDPISAIVSHYLGAAATRIFLFCVVLAMFASSLLGITTSSRLLFAVSRDKRFFAHQTFIKISKHGIPFYAVALVAVLEILIFLTMYGMSALYAAAVVLLFLAYLITVIHFAIGSRRLPPTKYFSLHKWHWPVVVIAILWLLFEIAILTIPEEFHLAALIAVGILVVGAIQYGIQHFLIKK